MRFPLPILRQPNYSVTVFLLSGKKDNEFIQYIYKLNLDEYKLNSISRTLI